MEILPQALIIVALIILNGFFVASEVVLITLRRSRIEILTRQKNPAAKFLQEALDNFELYVSAIQFGVTVCSLALGWLGESFITREFQFVTTIVPDGLPRLVVRSLSALFSFGLITYLSIVLGELIPKTIAIQQTDILSFTLIVPLVIFTKIFKPFINIFNLSAGFILKILKFKSVSPQIIYTEAELKSIVDEVTKSGKLAKEKNQLIQNAFRMADIQIKKLTMPKFAVTSLNVTTQLSEALNQIENQLHSRYPVYRGSPDNIIGFVHIKDIYRCAKNKETAKNLEQLKIVRKTITVPETKKAYAVMMDMRKKRVHMAIVSDEYGSPIGIVTLEDIIENLVGDIQDEFDIPNSAINKQPDGSFLMDGKINLEQIKQRLHLPINTQEYTSLGGFVFGKLGRQPKKGDIVKLDNCRLEITDVSKNRIKTIRFVKTDK